MIGGSESETRNDDLVVQVDEGTDDRVEGVDLRHQSPPHQRWWNNILDVRETKKQILFSMPMILTNVAYYMIPLTSVMFAGHLGDLELAASNLANSWSGVTGLAFMIGLSGALETLCGQGYGARLYRMLGIYLQSSCIISLFFCVLISILWWFSDVILTLMHQDPEISKAAGMYLKLFIPGLFAYALLQNMLRFLQTQSVVIPLVICSVLPLILHIGIAFLFVKRTSLAFRGAALAASISLWISVIMLGLYILNANKFKDTWNGFSLESLQYVCKTFKLALPCAAMICLEYWAFEILVLLAGLMPNPETTTSLIAMCVNTEAIAYMISSGLSAAVSTRVSNELGAGDHEKAKNAMYVALTLCVVLALVVDLAFGFGSHVWAGLFSGSPVIIRRFTDMTPFLVISIFIDFIQGILSGVTRGSGLQKWAAIINFGAFYIVGMTVAGVLGFKLKLHAKGLWLGLICGLTCVACGLLLLTAFTKWPEVDLCPDTGNEIISNERI